MSNHIENGINPETRLHNAIQAFNALYADDADWVRPGAEKHGVRVTIGGMTTPLSSGDYNYRVPTETPETIEAIKKASRIAIICEDYRQSAEAAKKLKADLVIATAGGAGQPKPQDVKKEGYQQRAAVLVELIEAMHQVNPNAVFILGYHTEICGGFNILTEGLNVSTYEHKGQHAEYELMKEAAEEIAYQLIYDRVPRNKIELHAVVLKHGKYVKDHFIKEFRRHDL